MTVALGSAALAAGCSSSSEATLHVENRSDFAIVQLHVTPVGNPDWGPNLLGSTILAPGDSAVLDVSCGTYDALLVDEAGVDCQVHSIDLCLNHADWIIGNETCTVFSAEKAARDADAAKARAGSEAPPDAPR